MTALDADLLERASEIMELCKQEYPHERCGWQYDLRRNLEQWIAAAMQAERDKMRGPSDEEIKEAKYQHYKTVWNGQNSSSYDEGWDGAVKYFRDQLAKK